MGLHFHAKSEHKLNGTQYDAEVHMVFKKAGVSVMEDDICVIGILFKIDDDAADENERKILKVFQPDFPKQALNVNFRELFEPTLLKNPSFLHYKGSLTTPPCTETVKWFVHSEIFHLKEEDLNSFDGKWVHNESFSPTGHGNSRPVCELFDRKIYKVRAQELVKKKDEK